ncbi:MAG: hypothetical protein ACUVXA_20055 [Candidatus Jordarchaeum sp.]|uniref:hypothetical protein n=1 Tax=Candidatus Jordarchaeum sp. TaxID=2823881 RepID=UPI0040499E9F
MTHEYSGKYASKHPPGTKPNEEIAKLIREKISEKKLSCAMAERISKQLNVRLSEVGKTADLMGIKIIKCQLGLFGWGNKPNHGKDIHPLNSVPFEVKSAIEKVAEKGRVSCSSLWEIADRLGIERKAVSTVCETLGLKIIKCQLGTF